MKVIDRNIVFATLLFISCPALFAQLPTITTAVDRNKILIGEQINYTVQVTMPASKYRLTWLTVPQDFGAFVLASTGKIDTAYSTGTLTFGQRMQITSFDSGRQVIPALAFQFATLSGDSVFQMLTDSVPVDVSFSPADSVLPFHDIKPILVVKKELPWWLWPAIIAALLLLIIAIFIIIRKRRKKKNNTIFDSPLTGFDEAMKLINDLRTEDLPSKGEFKPFFIKLTDIFKRYVSRLDNENKMHLTGVEVIEEFSHFNPARDLLDNFASGVRIADAVKFARFKPTILQSGECLDAIENSIKFIHSLKKEEEHDL